MPNIQAGYLLKLTSWENDGDHYRTIDLSGLTKGEVTYAIKLAKLFRSWGGSKPKPSIVWEAVSAIEVPDDVRSSGRFVDFDDFHDISEDIVTGKQIGRAHV